MHKLDGVVKNDGNGGRRWIVGKNPAMRIDYIDNKLIDCGLSALDIDNNIGVIHLVMMVHLKIKIK